MIMKYHIPFNFFISLNGDKLLNGLLFKIVCMVSETHNLTKFLLRIFLLRQARGLHGEVARYCHGAPQL